MEKERKLFTVLIDKNSYEVLNTEFTKAKCFIMYHGDNRNGNSMSKETVEAALPSLYNIPVVGEFKEEVKDFGTHGGKIEISDDGIKFIETTKPFGLVPESCNARWEIVKEEDGTEHEYLVADLILWNARYPELESTISSYSNESMEIMVGEGEVRQDGVYEIKKFEFSGLCLLGKDKTPCFENSKVVAYAIDEFKTEMDELVKQYKLFLHDEPEVEIPDAEIIIPVEFSATYRQKEEALENALDPIIVKDAEGNYISETYYSVSDFNETYVMVHRSIWTRDNYDRQAGRFTYSFNEETLIASITSEFEKMIEDVWLTEAEYQQLLDSRNQKEAEFQQIISSLTTEVNTLKTENSELLEYKNTNEFEIDKENILNVVSEFETVIGENEEFIVLKEKLNSGFEQKQIAMPIESIEKELYALVGKVKYQVKPTKKDKKIVSKVSISTEEKNEFGSAEKYFKK